LSSSSSPSSFHKESILCDFYQQEVDKSLATGCLLNLVISKVEIPFPAAVLAIVILFSSLRDVHERPLYID